MSNISLKIRVFLVQYASLSNGRAMMRSDGYKLVTGIDYKIRRGNIIFTNISFDSSYFGEADGDGV